MSYNQKGTVPVTVTVHVPISAVSAVRNATDNDKRIFAMANIASSASCAVVDAIMAAKVNGAEDLQLLSLPRELRDRIWKLVMVYDGNLRVRPQDYRFPAPLSTCKQMRAEAAPIYFGQNIFMCIVEDLKGAWMGRWTDIALGMLKDSGSPGRDIRCLLFFHGAHLDRENWHHLEAWLKTFHQGRCPRVPRSESLAPNPTSHRIMRNAFNIVEELLEDDWSKVSAILEQYRHTVI